MLSFQPRTKGIFATQVAGMLAFLAIALAVSVDTAAAGCGDYVIMLGSHEQEGAAVPRSEHRELGRFATPGDAEPMNPPCHGPRCQGNQPTATLPPLDEGTRESRDRQWVGISQGSDDESVLRGSGWSCFDEELPAFFALTGIERPPRV